MYLERFSRFWPWYCSKWWSTLRWSLLFKRILIILSVSFPTSLTTKDRTWSEGYSLSFRLWVLSEYVCIYIYRWMYVCDHVCTYIDSYVCCPLYTTWMCQEVAEENQRLSAAVRIQSFVSCRDLAVFPQPGWVPNGAHIYSRWWFQLFFIFTSIWGRFPFCYFSNGLKPPPSSFFFNIEVW